jgi:hypothetical protein
LGQEDLKFLLGKQKAFLGSNIFLTSEDKMQDFQPLPKRKRCLFLHLAKLPWEQ